MEPALLLVYVLFGKTTFFFLHIYTNDASWDSYTDRGHLLARPNVGFRGSQRRRVFVRIIIIVQAVSDVTVIGLSTRKT